MKNFWAILSLMSILSTSAMADQCEWISGEQARAAISQLRLGKKFISYCEPCGNAQGPAQVITSFDVSLVDDGKYHAVWINGKTVDLAYVFIQTNGNIYKNLSDLANCPAEEVSESLVGPN